MEQKIKEMFAEAAEEWLKRMVDKKITTGPDDVPEYLGFIKEKADILMRTKSTREFLNTSLKISKADSYVEAVEQFLSSHMKSGYRKINWAAQSVLREFCNKISAFMTREARRLREALSENSNIGRNNGRNIEEMFTIVREE